MQTIPFNVDLNPNQATHFVIKKELGYSKFPVYQVQILPQGGEYAVKVFPDTEQAYEAYLKELDVLHTVSHPNIVRIRSDVSFENMNSTKCHYVLLEYAPYGDFFSLVKSRGLSNQKLVRTYFHQLIEGLEHLHLHKIAHLDLKLENLLLGMNFRLELADFEQSRTIKEKVTLNHGTSCHRSPEILAGKCEDIFAADIYSAGVVLFLLRSREFPFIEQYKGGKWELLDYDLFQKNNKLFWEKKSQNKKDPAFFSESFKELINGMLEADPLKRWTLQDIKNSTWYNQTILTEIELKLCIEKVVERMSARRPVKIVP